MIDLYNDKSGWRPLSDGCHVVFFGKLGTAEPNLSPHENLGSYHYLFII